MDGRTDDLMTFLLFLASVAVLEYLVSGSRRPDRSKAVEAKHDVTVSNETLTADLLALGQALGVQNAVAEAEKEVQQER